jgi:protein O-GlcNAc transferase
MIESIQPENAEALRRDALECSKNGNWEAAREFLDRAILAEPLVAEYRLNLGVVLESLNRPEEAATAYRLALEIDPACGMAHIHLGNLFARQMQWRESIEAFGAAAVLRPTDADVQNSLGAAYLCDQQIEPAMGALARAIELRPDFAEAYNNVGNALYAKGELDLATVSYRKAVGLKPDLIDAQINLANILDRRGLREEALAIHHLVVAARPDRGLSYLAIANTLRAKMDLDGAIANYRRAIELLPNSVEAFNNLGIALREQGLIDDALDATEKAVELAPGNAAVLSNLVYLLSFHAGYDPAELARQQRNWNEKHAKPLAHLIRPHANDRDPDRKLKVGYVSPNFGHHVVGQNFFPLLSKHDRREFAVHCYSTVIRPDPFTEVLREQADVWRNAAGMSDEALAEAIRQDGIDILVDLSSHMAENRLLVFARKPAPVQVTYLGYCASTGLSAMDYRLSDPYLDPAEADLSLYNEQTVRLPETYWCYTSAGPTPEPSPPPSQSAGHITFGCLNNFAKVSPGALDLWAEILAGLPGSRMIIHSYPGSHLAAVRDRFAAAGVSADRLEFLPKLPWTQYVQTYGRIDIALDPFPYGGGITTCDALWMGVPVVTLAGQTAVGRGGKSILSNLGLVELTTRRPRQYVQTALTLANSPQRLAELRRDLRRRMLTSPLMNATKFARSVEEAFRWMWRQYAQR